MEQNNANVSGRSDEQQAFLNLLKEWFNYILKKWWLILLIGILAGIGGILYVTLQKPKYESRLTFALEDNGGGGGLGGALSLASEFGFNIGGGKNIFAGDNIMEILSSRRMIERVLLASDSTNGKVYSLADEILDFSGLKKDMLINPRLSKVSFPVAQPRESFSYLQDSILYIIFKDISENKLTIQKPDKRLNVYEVKMQSPSERFSKIFTEILINETTTFYTELKSRRSRETLEILEQRVASLKGALNSSITTRANTQDANLNPAFASAQTPIQKKEIDIRVLGGAYGELFKNLELARYQYLKEIPLLQIIDEPRYPLINLKKGRFKTGLIFAFAGSFLITIFLVIIKYLRNMFG